MIVNKARLKRCYPRRFMLELDNDNNLNNDNVNDNPPPTNDVIPTHITKRVRFKTTIEIIGDKHKKRRKKKNSQNITHTASTTQSEPSTVNDTSIQTKVTTVTHPSVKCYKRRYLFRKKCFLLFNIWFLF